MEKAYMTKYTKDAFQQYFDLQYSFKNKNPLLEILANSSERDLMNNIFTQEAIEKYLNFRMNFEREQSKLPIVSELRKEPCIIKAKELLNRASKGNAFSIEKRIEKEVKNLESKISDNPKNQIKAIKTAINRIGIQNEWEPSVIRYVAAYIHKKHETKDSPISNAINKISDFLRAAKEIEEMPEKEIYIGFGPILTAAQRRRMHATLSKLQAKKKHKITRHHAEKIFVRKMLILHKKHFKEPRISVIAELMHLPFFQHQFDVRTLNRFHQEMQGQD